MLVHLSRDSTVLIGIFLIRSRALYQGAG